MSDSVCKHLKLVQEDVKPSADGCEDCLKIGDILGAFASLSYLWPRRML